jgi:hypothetical protein
MSERGGLLNRDDHWSFVCGGMNELTRLTDRIWLTSMVTARCEDALEAAGIDAVCNLTQEDYACAREHYFFLDQWDSEPIAAYKIQRFVRWMAEQRDAGRAVLVHCHAGISRTSAFVIFWMMWADGVSRDGDLRLEWSKREDVVRFARRIIMPHWKLKQSLLAYYERYGPE